MVDTLPPHPNPLPRPCGSGERGRKARATPREILDQHQKSLQRILRAPGETAADQLGERGVPQRDAAAARALAQRFDRALADAAWRRVHGALERGVVVA